MAWNRVTSGFVAVGFALAVTILGGWYFTFGIAVLIGFGQWEYFKLVQATGTAPAIRTTLFMSQLIVILQQVKPDWTMPAFTIAGSIICFYLLFKPQVATIADVATSVLGLFYCAYLPSFWIRVRAFDIEGHPGLTITLLAFACISAADIGAYLVGKTFGKTRLSIISPKKTVEGAVFGVVSSTVIAILGAYLLNWPLGWMSGGVIGVLIGVTSLLGDLTESLMKRNAGVKDSGALLPGHGGILDRADSYVFTAPLVFYFLQLLLNLPLGS